jgi:hypothetical protein
MPKRASPRAPGPGSRPSSATRAHDATSTVSGSARSASATRRSHAATRPAPAHGRITSPMAQRRRDLRVAAGQQVRRPPRCPRSWLRPMGYRPGVGGRAVRGATSAGSAAAFASTSSTAGFSAAGSRSPRSSARTSGAMRSGGGSAPVARHRPGVESGDPLLQRGRQSPRRGTGGGLDRVEEVRPPAAARRPAMRPRSRPRRLIARLPRHGGSAGAHGSYPPYRRRWAAAACPCPDTCGRARAGSARSRSSHPARLPRLGGHAGNGLAARIRISRAAVAASSRGAQTSTMASSVPAPSRRRKQLAPVRAAPGALSSSSEWVMNGGATGTR